MLTLQVWKYYHDKRQQVASGCKTEMEVEGQEGSSCHALDNLERLVYEVAFSGDAEQLYHVLRVGLPAWPWPLHQPL